MARRKQVGFFKPTKKKVKKPSSGPKKMKLSKATPEISTLMRLGINVKDQETAKKVLEQIYKEAKEKNQTIELASKRFRDKKKI